MDENSIREAWETGAICEIYSHSEKTWFKGIIARIFIDEEGEWLEVIYSRSKNQWFQGEIIQIFDDQGALMSQQIQRYCDDIKPYECSVCSKEIAASTWTICNICESEIYGNFIFSLTINDKVDVFDMFPSMKCWHVATILHIKNEDNSIKILIHYDGWEDKWNEWIMVDQNDIISSRSRIEKLHTYTPHHHYLINPSIKPCKWMHGKSTSIRCGYCSKICCKTCFIAKADNNELRYQCKLCMDKTENTNLFKLVNSYSLFYNTYDIDINIVYLITNYSKGVISVCSNGTDPCSQHGIFYPSKFDFQLYHDQAIPINGRYECELSFEHMGLYGDVLQGIYYHGWNKPGAMQERAILNTILRHDIIVQSPSCTGKTGVFSIASLQIVDFSNSSFQVLILSPTRELARQTYRVMTDLSSYINGLTYALCVDGTSVSGDTQIIMGTPQRVIELISMGTLNLNSLELLILDEADEVLLGPHRDQTNIIFQYLPPSIQYALFSATIPRELLQLASEFMRDPVRIVEDDEWLLDNIKQYYIDVDEEDKLAKLAYLNVKSLPKSKAIIFVNTPEKAAWLYNEYGEELVGCIHHKSSREHRDSIMEDFRLRKIRVLISTDSVFRGVDAVDVSVIINYDLPLSKESYIHRIGRIGRDGRKGCAISFITESDAERVRSFERFYDREIREFIPDDLSKVDTIALTVNGELKFKAKYVDTIALAAVGRVRHKIMVKYDTHHVTQHIKDDVISLQDTGEVDYDYRTSDKMIQSTYSKRRRSKIMQRNKYKKINNHRTYYKKKMDKRSNVKQNRRFNQRYALLLQQY